MFRFDFNDPFFKPLWLRVVLVGSTFVWAGIELVTGSILWTMLFAALGAYAFYGLFVAFAPRDTRDKPEGN